jgi:hypothetical protein
MGDIPLLPHAACLFEAGVGCAPRTIVRKGPRSNKLAFLLAVAGALRRCPPLAVLALRRVGRLALHPATTAKMHNLLLRGP